MQTSYNAEKVAVTVNLTAEAAKILRQYAGERNRGRFLSDLIMEQRRRDDLERQSVAGLPGKAAEAGGLPGKAAEAGGLPGKVAEAGGLPGKAAEAGGLPGKAAEAGGRAQQSRNQGGRRKSRKGR